MISFNLVKVILLEFDVAKTIEVRSAPSSSSRVESRLDADRVEWKRASSDRSFLISRSATSPSPSRHRLATRTASRPKISSSLSGEFRYYETRRPMSPQADPNVIHLCSETEVASLPRRSWDRSPSPSSLTSCKPHPKKPKSVSLSLSSPIGRSGHLERERPTPHLFHRPAAANSASFGGLLPDLRRGHLRRMGWAVLRGLDHRGAYAPRFQTPKDLTDPRREGKYYPTGRSSTPPTMRCSISLCLPSARCTPPCTPTPILEQLQQQQSQQAEAVGT